MRDMRCTGCDTCVLHALHTLLCAYWACACMWYIGICTLCTTPVYRCIHPVYPYIQPIYPICMVRVYWVGNVEGGLVHVSLVLLCY